MALWRQPVFVAVRADVGEGGVHRDDGALIRAFLDASIVQLRYSVYA